MAVFPDLIPGADFAERQFAGVSLDIEYRISDGDMFAFKPDDVRPLQPEEDMLLEQYTIAWDEDGFRIPAIQADRYPIMTIGDSFTEGANVPLPWADGVAAALDVPVRNYGYRNYGPLEYQDVLANYATTDERTWLLYGHFSGNDLGDVMRSEEQLVAERDPFYLFPWITEQAQRNFEREFRPITKDHYTYPMPTIIGGNYYDLALHEHLLWWQRAPENGFAESRSYDMLSETLDMADEILPETCKAFIFIPTKEQLYFPYIEFGTRKWLMYVGERPEPGADGILRLNPAPLGDEDDAQLIDEILYEQRDAMQALAEEKGWIFIDLLDPFAERVAQGELLYYKYDTHWNQAGHTLAADVIAEAVQNAIDCPME
ncbi:MAG: alginate O-acetyltransferase AlgX-related protein [Aggregatilineales bacterium]